MKVQNDNNDYRLTASGAGAMLGITGAAVVALANRGRVPCVRDSANRRLFARRDIAELLKQRQAARRPKVG